MNDENASHLDEAHGLLSDAQYMIAKVSRNMQDDEDVYETLLQFDKDLSVIMQTLSDLTSQKR